MNTTLPYRPLVIFDGDDTLWSTMPLYTRAKKVFAQKVAFLAVEEQEAIDVLDEIDAENVGSMGFDKQRFTTSLAHAYRVLSSLKSVPVDSLVEEEIKSIGRSVFTSTAETAPGAKAALMRLRLQCSIALLTKGDLQVQKKRILDSGLSKCFHSTSIVQDKTAETFQLLLRRNDCPASKAWSIGNSVRSDILPPLSLGMSAIWIPSPTWRYEETAILPEPRFFKCATLEEAVKLVLERTT
jgi:putative hydrolase of the HAD superfamily